MSFRQPLPATALLCRCDPGLLKFETTRDLEPLDGPVFQERALDAARFGVGIRRQGYNLFVMGPTGSGRHRLITRLLEEQARGDAVPQDLCYVRDFAQSHRPRALLLPPGTGRKLQRAVAHLVDELRQALPRVFDTDEFKARKDALETELKARADREMAELRQRAERAHVAIIKTPMGVAVAPVKDGEIISPDDFQKLPEDERKRLAEDLEHVQAALQERLEQAPKLEREIRERMRALVREVADRTAAHAIDDLKREFETLPDIVAYLEAFKADVVENVDEFIKPSDSNEGPTDGASDLSGTLGHPRFRRYRVNVIVDHGETRGAPVVYEDNPTYQNIVGRIEHLSQLGALVTDFNLIRAGALHRANGGYLVIDAHRLLTQPYAYEGLKRALLAHQVRIESLGQMLSIISTLSLEPEPVPLDVKIALVGERELYYLLDHYDPEFRKLFKVVVDLEDEADRDEGAMMTMARLIAGAVRDEQTRHLDASAVSAVIERSSRVSGDNNKLSTRMRALVDLLREADYWAGQRKSELISRSDVERAVEAEEQRLGRVRARVLERITEGTVMVETRGERVGQINGLSVIDIGRAPFGRPTRITASVRMGRGDVVDIEREVDLGGPLHSKGVLILSSFLSSRFGQRAPLAFSASLVFEQSYGMVDGDSASCAELCALLSALSGVPIRQSFAITGSINQHGDVQPIGGVNEKIEGFFELCSQRGHLPGCGVIIPATNVRHLSLKPAVVDACARGDFAIHAVTHVDEAIELLTGVAAGIADAWGSYPARTINALVDQRLTGLQDRRLELERAAREKAPG